MHSQLLGVGLGRFQRRDASAPADHHNIIADFHNLIQVMGNQDNGLAVLRQSPEAFEQITGFLGREHCRRLIQNKDLRTAVKNLQNLHLLLQSNSQASGRRVKRHLHAKPFLQIQNVFSRLFIIQGNTPRGLHAQDDVFQYAQLIDQHKMLVHHSDFQADGIPAGAEAHMLAPDLDLPAGRGLQPIENIHQRGFSRAILPHQTHHGPLADSHGNIVVGDYRAVLLPDMV